MAEMTEIHAQMRAAVHGVLEMMFTSPVLADTQFPPAGWVDPITVGLNFHGQTKRGICALAVEEPTARSLASVFLCTEVDSPPLTRESSWEVMCELSNMICGSFLGSVDRQESYRLSSPRSLLPGEIGLIQPLHMSTLQTKHGDLLFVIAVEADKG